MLERFKHFLERGTGTRSSSQLPDGGDSPSNADEALTTLEGTTQRPSAGDIGRLRKERRRLLKAREQAVRDLGGLTLEMVRLDTFKPDLLMRRARDILGLEASAHDVEDTLAEAKRSIPSPGIGATAPCTCGAANEPSASFCRDCGRALTPDAGTRRCNRCASTLPGDAAFCPCCGVGTETPHESATGSGW